MRGLAPRSLAAFAALAASLALAAPALGAPAVNGIFELKTELSSNNKIVAAPDGNVWFTLDSATKDVGSITPAGVVSEYELPKIENPIGITPGPGGRLWVVATGKATSFLPADPKGSEVTFESGEIQAEPNIVLGPDGLMWVASNNKVARFSPTAADPKSTIKEVKLEGELSPKDIDVAGPLIAIADNNGTEKRIVTFSSAGVQKDFAIKGASQGLAGAPSGQIAYSDAGASPEQSGLITPPNPAQSFEMLGDPFGVTYGIDEAFWIVRFAKGDLARVTPTGATTFLPGLPIETARQVAAGANGTLWVTMQKKEKVTGPAIARISGLEPPAGPPAPGSSTPQPGPVPAGPGPVVLPTTALGTKPKKVVKTTGETATVKFSFSSTTAGAGFECSIAKRVKPKGKKARFVGKGFKGCKSPKSYVLQPGRYRFQVRAVSGSLRDSSPAQSTFKVIHVARK